METQTLFDVALALAGVLGGWSLKVIWESIRKIELEVRQLEQKIHQDYVRREDFKSDIADLKADMRVGFQDLRQIIQILSEKIDRKEDRQT